MGRDKRPSPNLRTPATRPPRRRPPTSARLRPARPAAEGGMRKEPRSGDSFVRGTPTSLGPRRNR